jgi:hypothetical protein
MKTLIGKAEISYLQDGKVNSARFTPNHYVITPKNSSVFRQLEDLEVGPQEDKIVKQAELMMATWFSKLNDIEMADREKYKIVSEMDECHKYPNGQPSKVSVSFYFTDIPSPVKS